MTRYIVDGVIERCIGAATGFKPEFQTWEAVFVTGAC
jgi:hypothetical protein